MRRIILLLLLPVVIMTVIKGEILNLTILPGDGVGGCLSMDLRQTALQEVRDQVQTFLSTFSKGTINS